jgi:hypothetical protein
VKDIQYLENLILQLNDKIDVLIEENKKLNEKVNKK